MNDPVQAAQLASPCVDLKPYRLDAGSEASGEVGAAAVGDVVGEKGGRDAALAAIVALARSTCNASGARIELLTNDACVTLCAVGSHVPQRAPHRTALSHLLDVSSGYAHSEDTDADTRFAICPEVHDGGVRACAGVPLHCAHSGGLGVLVVTDTSARAWSPACRQALDQLAILAVNLLQWNSVGGQAAVAIERVHEHQDERQDERQASPPQAVEERLQQALTLAGLGTWSYDVGLSILSISALTCEIMGLPAHTREISVYEYVGIVHPADRLRVWRECFNSLAQGRALKLQYRLQRRDGAVRYVQGSSQPEFGADQKILRYTGLLEDLTESRYADHLAQLSRRAMQASNNCVLIADANLPDMPLIDVNPTFEHLTGYSRAEVLGRNCRFLQRDDRDQSGLHEIRAALAQQREGHATLRNYKKDGTLFWADLRIAPLRDEYGRVSHYAAYLRDASERVSFEESVAHQAMHDPLTGLPNRHLLQDRLAQAIVRAAQDGRQVGVAMIDLDRFKRVNDSLGHVNGDELLKQIAQRLGRLARDGDTVARFGGDEFVFVIANASCDPLTEFIDNIAAQVALPMTIQGNSLDTSASIGVAVYPAHGASATDLIKNADAAMYYAKEKGRARSHFFDASLSVTANIKFEIEAELVRALRDHEFVLHYQPEIDARSGALRGFEALIRWQHPQRGLLGPDVFISIAEESGLIEKIGEWVMVQACLQNREWQMRGMTAVPISVNVSRVQFRRAGFVERIKEILVQTGLSARYLCLEVTESMVMEEVERLRIELEALRALGVLIAIDDFGTGYSSLSLIKQLPVDILKIDRAFVRDLSTDPSDAAICQTIIAMAQGLGLQVVAEGVETEAQVRFLQEYGCDILQGYALCRPRPAAQAEAFVLHEWQPESIRLAGVLPG